jgi:hypothetical protein
MMRTILLWICTLLGSPQAQRAAPATLIDRRLRFIGEGQLDAELCSRTRNLEIRLRDLRVRLQEIVTSEAAAAIQSLALLQQLGEFLEAEGAFARTIRNWSSEDPLTENRLRMGVTEGEHLAQEADAILVFVAEHKHANATLTQMRERFAESVPGAWESIGQPLCGLLRDVRSLTGVRQVGEQLGDAQAALARRHDALGSLANELLPRVELSASEREEIDALHSREAAVGRLMELAREQGSDLRARAIALVDVQADHHLRYAGARRTDLAVRGKPLGTPERALARWKQLRKIADTRVRYV